MNPEEVAAANAAVRERYREYLGRYLANFHGFQDTPLTITAHHGRLALEVPGMRLFELDEPDAEGRFGLMGMPAFGISFERDAAGAIGALRFHDGESSSTAPRMSEGGG
jgi:hypothetical protein